jgi:hypothetical protein
MNLLIGLPEKIGKVPAHKTADGAGNRGGRVWEKLLPLAR